MRALVHHRYGTPDVLRIEDVPEPTPAADEVLVRVHAASINPLDWHAVTGLPLVARAQSGLRRPKRIIRGADVAGRVEAVGSAVDGIAVGDDVFGAGAGSFAEAMCIRARSITRAPSNLAAAASAAVPIAGLTALQALRDKGQLRSGQAVLIIGASGGVGTFAVQIARALGAEVTGVCSTNNVELVRSLGADRVIDYTESDFTVVEAGRRYDLIIDNVGNRSVRDRRRVMTPKGRCVVVGGPKGGRLLGPASAMLRSVIGSKFVSQSFVPLLAVTKADDLVVLRDFIESGAVQPVVSETIQLNDVPAALARMGAGHTRGKVVVDLRG